MKQQSQTAWRSRGKWENQQSRVEQPASKKVSTSEIVTLYPNPANSQLHLYYYADIKGQAVFELFNNLGQVAQTQILQQGVNSATFDVSNIIPGLYYWRLRDNVRNVSSGKVSVIR